MSNKVSIGEVLSKAWRIIWKFKVLWIFGILAGCAGGNGSRFNFNGNSFGNNTNNGQLPQFMRPFANTRPDLLIQQILSGYAGFIALGIVLLCVLWFVFFFLGVMGKTALIKGASKADLGVEKMSFGELWTESTPYFWRMFGLKLLVGLPFFLLFVILLVGLGFAGYASFTNGAQGGGLAAIIFGLVGIFIGVTCFIAILSIIVGMVVEQAQNAIVLEDLGIIQGLVRGWNVFKSAVLTIILMVIIMSVFGWIIGLILALPFIAIAIPAAIGMAGAFAAKARGLIALLVLAGCCLIAYLPVLLVLSGILQAYTQTVWTLVYRRLTSQPAPAVVDAPSQAPQVSI